jgi:hypothetical protein
MNKLEKIDIQEQKTRDKITALQAILKQIDGARTEQENLQIVQQVRALKLSRDELYAFLGGGVLPPSLLGAIGGVEAAPETIYTQPERKRRNERNAKTEPETETPDESRLQETDSETTNTESEGMNHEEQ